MENQHKYHLKTGATGKQQLDNLDYFFGKESRKFLKHIGLVEGMSVLDVGCGVGNLSCWLAEQVGPSGRVVAVDNDAGQVEVARQSATKKGISNIAFEQVDAHDLSTFNNQFDLTYCRWLLVHVRNPAAVVNSMASTLRPGGIVACEVGDLNSSFYYPSFSAYIYLRDKITQLLKQSGNDTEIALNIVKICKALDHFSFDTHLSQRVLHEVELAKTFTVNFTLVLNSMSESLLKNKLMSQEEIDQVCQELQSHTIDDNTLVFLARMTQVWCKRLQ